MERDYRDNRRDDRDGNDRYNRRSGDNREENRSGDQRRFESRGPEDRERRPWHGNDDRGNSSRERSTGRPAYGERSSGEGNRGRFENSGERRVIKRGEGRETRNYGDGPRRDERGGERRFGNDTYRNDTYRPERRTGEYDSRRRTDGDRDRNFSGGERSSYNRRDSGFRSEGSRDGDRFPAREDRFRGRGDDSQNREDRPKIVRKSTDRRFERPERSERSERFERPERSERPGQGRSFGDNRYQRDDSFRRPERRGISAEEQEGLRQSHYSKKKILEHRLKNETEETELRLNRYISMGGVCSRRDADVLIKSGRVKVNGEVVKTVGVKVQKKDRVEVDSAIIIPERKVYLVLNKPKDFVTTVEDPMERRTVMSLVEGACKERIYPVGRLDRQTTGVLLFTNDGELTKKLTHPKYEHKKIYHVFLDKELAEADFKAILKGVELEDGYIQADEIEYASEDHMEVGVEIHSGKNRIVRRIFEHFGYQIVKLDRVYFAGITKKNVPRGKWRLLTQEEVSMLKYY